MCIQKTRLNKIRRAYNSGFHDEVNFLIKKHISEILSNFRIDEVGYYTCTYEFLKEVIPFCRDYNTKLSNLASINCSQLNSLENIYSHRLTYNWFTFFLPQKNNLKIILEAQQTDSTYLGSDVLFRNPDDYLSVLVNFQGLAKGKDDFLIAEVIGSTTVLITNLSRYMAQHTQNISTLDMACLNELMASDVDRNNKHFARVATKLAEKYAF